MHLKVSLIGTHYFHNLYVRIWRSSKQSIKEGWAPFLITLINVNGSRWHEESYSRLQDVTRRLNEIKRHTDKGMDIWDAPIWRRK